MAEVRNLSKEVITTITAGNIAPDGVKTVEDWECPLIEMIHGKKVLINSVPENTIKKKGKK